MKFLLLSIVLNYPAFMGEFENKTACQAAMREIMVKRVLPPGAAETPLTSKVIDEQMRAQREFVCVAKG